MFVCVCVMFVCECIILIITLLKSNFQWLSSIIKMVSGFILPEKNKAKGCRQEYALDKPFLIGVNGAILQMTVTSSM